MKAFYLLFALLGVTLHAVANDSKTHRRASLRSDIPERLAGGPVALIPLRLSVLLC